MTNAPQRNALANETSPYLLQHADNPVAWRPWGPEALADAKANNKPILMSIGYAACHWCHVMAHESFEDEATATLMNELYVNIKVDREERPDLDAIYQRALQHMGQQGGWPLTMFLTPDGEPFWGGTYFPPDSRYGRPGFPDVLQSIHSYWTDKQDAIAKNVASLRDALAQMGTSSGGGEIRLEVAERAAIRLAEEFDKINGGIGTAPKFPNPTILELLWRTHRRCGTTGLGQIVTHALDRMSQGGIYDHLGGGYARYSTDAEWLAPHFEKMLYDNAQLIDLLRWAWCETGNNLFEIRLRETIGWTLREMIADGNGGAGGGFAATLDADSEGVEGKYYVWDAAEIAGALGDDAALFNEAYDVKPGGNWEGHTILNRTTPPRNFTEAEERRLSACRDILLAIRETRIHPGWDDKVLADWNGLMIAAIAGAGATFNEPGWIAAARTAFDFVTGTMEKDGRLFHAWRAGKLNHTATLDDYAGMIRAGVALFEITGAPDCLAAAIRWADVLQTHYLDAAGGGYFFTADDAEALIVRTKTAEDHATPAGNGVMVQNFARLYFLTGEERFRTRADIIITAFSGELDKNFFPFATLMNGAELLQCAEQIVIVGRRNDSDTKALLEAVFKTDSPNRVLSVIAPGATLPDGHPAAGKDQIDGAATAYVCVGPTCSLPLTQPQALARAIG
jgi:uncharacterized protein YyaL (SSP411 family)